MPDCSTTTVRNCYASEPPWNTTDKYRESRHRRSREGSRPDTRCGTPPLFINNFPVTRKSPDPATRKNTERFGNGSPDAGNCFQPRPTDERHVAARSVDDSGCTFVTPSFATQNSADESVERLPQIWSSSRRKGSSRSRCREKSFHNASTYSTAGEYHRQSADASDVHTAPGNYSQAPEIGYTVVRHGAVLASDVLSTHGKGRSVAHSNEHRSRKGQFEGSNLNDFADLSGVRNESSFTHVTTISQPVTPTGWSKRCRSRRSSYGRFEPSPTKQVFQDQTAVWLEDSRGTPMSQQVAPSSSSRRHRSRKSLNSQSATLPFNQISPNQTSVWLDGSREISQILPTGQPCVTSSHLPSIRDGSYVSFEPSPRGQYVTSMVQNSSPVPANGVDIVSPHDQLHYSSDVSRHRSNRSSCRSRRIQNCSPYNEVAPDDFSTTRDTTYMPYQESYPTGQYLSTSPDQLAAGSFSPNVDGSHIPSQDPSPNQFVSSSSYQVVQEKSSPIKSHSRRSSSRNQYELSSQTHAILDSFLIEDVSQISSQKRSTHNGVTTLIEPQATSSLHISSYMSPQLQNATPNDLSLGIDEYRLPSQAPIRNQFEASPVEEVVPRDLSTTRDGFQMSLQMSPKYQYLPSADEPPVSDDFTGYSYTSPKAHQWTSDNQALARNGLCMPSFIESPRYRYLASKPRALTFATPSTKYTTPSNITMERASSLQSPTKEPTANKASWSHIEPYVSQTSYLGSAFAEAATHHSPNYFRDAPTYNDACLSSSVALPASLYTPTSRSLRDPGQSMAGQDSYEAKDVPIRRRRKNTFSGNPWFTCSTRQSATTHDYSSRDVDPPTTPKETPRVTSTMTYINLSTATTGPQNDFVPSSGVYDSFSTPQSRYHETRLAQESDAVKLVPGSIHTASQETDTSSKNVNDKGGVDGQSNRYRTLASLEMARDPTQRGYDSVSHAISLDASAPLQGVPRNSSAAPDGSLVVASDTTMIINSTVPPPATSTPRHSRETATVSRMFGDESAILPKDEPGRKSSGIEGRQGTQPKVVNHDYATSIQTLR